MINTGNTIEHDRSSESELSIHSANRSSEHPQSRDGLAACKSVLIYCYIRFLSWTSKPQAQEVMPLLLTKRDIAKGITVDMQFRAFDH